MSNSPSTTPDTPLTDAPKHTPGPWSVHPALAWVTPASAPENPVAALQWPSIIRSEEETKANARLIAAAPALVEALEVAKHMLGPHMIRSCGTCEKCGGTTSNGTLKVCRKCGMEIIEQALTQAREV
jgi:hypothetical protein